MDEIQTFRQNGKIVRIFSTNQVDHEETASTLAAIASRALIEWITEPVSFRTRLIRLMIVNRYITGENRSMASIARECECSRDYVHMQAARFRTMLPEFRLKTNDTGMKSTIDAHMRARKCHLLRRKLGAGQSQMADNVRVAKRG